MNWMNYAGFIVAVAGLGGVVYCLIAAVRIRNSTQSGDQIRQELQRLFPINLTALFTAIFGLLLVVIGLFL